MKEADAEASDAKKVDDQGYVLYSLKPKQILEAKNVLPVCDLVQNYLNFINSLRCSENQAATIDQQLDDQHDAPESQQPTGAIPKRPKRLACKFKWMQNKKIHLSS